jgi:uncharacterized protein (DUF952 family)
MNILHITDDDSWLKAKEKGIYEADTLVTNGFIHCCLPDQVPGVLAQWFRDTGNLILLEIDPAKLKSAIEYENLEGGQELFPHIYGPVNLDAVVAVRKVEEKNEGRNCSEAVHRKSQ